MNEEAKDPFIVAIETQVALEKALAEIQGRSFSGRHPELGKMIKCQFCRTRHRANERKCEQVFTYRIGDYEYFREETDKETGETKLVPDYRTAVHPNVKPTMKQIIGAAAFKGKRVKPHPSKLKLRLIEVTREVFLEKGFSLDEKAEQFQKDLAVARKIAGDRVVAERKYRNRDVRRKP